MESLPGSTGGITAEQHRWNHCLAVLGWYHCRAAPIKSLQSRIVGVPVFFDSFTNTNRMVILSYRYLHGGIENYELLIAY